MRSALRRWLLSAAVLCAPALQAAPSNVELVGDAVPDLAGALRVLEDPGGRLDLDAVARLPMQQWAPLAAWPPDFGLSHSTWWLRLHLRNPHPSQRIERLLEVGSPRQDEIELMQVRGDGIVQRFPVTGDRHPFAQRPLAHRHLLFPLTLEPHETLTVYLRVASHDGLHEPLPMRLWSHTDFAAHADAEALLYGLYFGGLLALMVYNLFLCASARVAGLGAYAAYLGAVLTWSATFNGFSFRYLLPSHPALANQLLAVAAAACFASAAVFVVRYLGTRRTAPRWHLWLLGLAAADAGAALPALFDHYRLAFLCIVPLGCLTTAAIVAVAVRQVLQGHRAARYLLVSPLVMGLGVAMYLLSMWSLLPPSAGVDAVALIQGGLAFEVLVLAFGLADSLNEQKAAALRAEHDARVSRETLARQLEEQVQQRTQELGLANARLSEQAITDDLTGVFNRRHFGAVFEGEIRRRGGRVLGLCLVDVDHFKAYNDAYGHVAGDAALRAVAATLQQHLRRTTDLLFRVGGEEFAIIFRTVHADEASAYVETLREALADLGLPHLNHPAGVMTASFGLAVVESGGPVGTASELYKLADVMLYEAKAAGRNVVRCARLEPPARTSGPGPAVVQPFSEAGRSSANA